MGRPPLISNKALLSVARSIFLDHGLSAPVKEIADAAGLSEAALFKRYPRKRDLMVAAMVPPSPDIEALLAPLADASDIRGALSEIARLLLDHYRTNLPVVIPLIAHPEIGFSGIGEGPASAVTAKLVVALGTRLDTLAGQGLISDIDGAAAAGLLVSTTHSIVLFEMMGMHSGVVPPHALETMLDVFWTGLNPQKEI